MKNGARERAVISYSDEDYSVLQKIVQAEAGVCDDRERYWLQM